jgi:pimeloyl-ACP methyl ester carboxylesterase
MEPNYFKTESANVAWYQTGSGKPLLMLHGWGSSSKVMMPLAGRIQSYRTCYLIDFPGFGSSTQPSQPWSVSDYADVLEDFIKENMPEGTIDLLVHSFGARVAVKLLSEREIGMRFDKIVFTGAAGLKPRRSLRFYLRKFTAKLLKAPFMILPESYRESGLNKLRTTRLWKSLGSSDYRKLSGVMRQTFVSTVNEHLDGKFPSIQQEILLIWGKADRSTPLEQAKRMDKLLPSSALVILEDAGHYAFIDKPAQFASIVKAYLEPE